jgi:hypothetical protein
VPTFTVTGIQKVEDKPAEGEYRAQKVISFGLQEAGKEPLNARWWTVPDANVPAVGSQIEGTLEQKPYGWKFKKASAGGFGGGGRGRSPEETKAIVRQHSQEMALRYAAIRAQQGKLPEDFKLTDLATIINWFVKDAAA